MKKCPSSLAVIAGLSISPVSAEIIRMESDGASNLVTLMRDVTYSQVKAGFARNQMQMDLLLPASETPSPAIVFVMGNGWQSIDRSILLAQIAPLAKAGYVVASIDYRIIGEETFPEPERDVKTAIRFLRANAARFNIDPERIGLMGNSAGGHLVLMAGLTEGEAQFDSAEWADQPSTVKGIVAFYPPVYLEKFAASPTDRAAQHMGGDLGDPANADLVRQGSPSSYVDPQDPPVLLIHGTQDETVSVDHSDRLYEDLTRQGVDATYLRIENVGHAFGKVTTVPGVMDQIIAFFDRTVKAD